MDGGRAGNTGRYAASPLVAYDRGLATATDLLRMQVSPAAINFELRREHGFTEAQAAVVIHEASALVPRRDPSQSGLRTRLPQRLGG